ncbi:BamA/TamA family outer membrane protein [Deminuibacter soli]|uniref:Metallophosphoesterase n=1 Tax=Deminuibacter soli TaxID=2291815 RepID=A0A3E1NQK6_9BACT|nr:BamA/TamA family outer membrane protein [Deminuibacter soli]RFM30203.1 hypothetical protein DXN05_04325 [Deminuibacter soli]
MIARLKRIGFFALLLLPLAALSQDSSVVQRIILMGDAGEINAGQQALIRHAAANVLPGKTVSVYLGDNIYPKGMALQAGGQDGTQNILRSQFEPMRSKGATVYFVPGNHDWDGTGVNGYAKIVRQGDYLESLGDSLLKLLPPDGCPGPVEIPIGDNVVIIAADSEWWLFPYGKPSDNAGCECTTKDEVIARMEDLLYKNRFKVIFFATHHPFKSYGPHGGYFSLRQHLFPFTDINKNLYLPLPVVGSLYPLYRVAIPNPEDLRHPLYKDMIKRFSDAMKPYPNIIHVSGHEHTLQLINGNMLQVISGADSKTNTVKKGRNSLFAQGSQGYVTADVLANNAVRLTCYSFENDTIKPVFSWVKSFVAVKEQEEAVLNATYPDSVRVAPFAAYDSVSRWHRSMFGENYRKEWSTPAMLPVFKLSVTNGGFTPLQRGGGHQTKSLRLRDKEGKEWVLRTIQKNPEAALPDVLKQTFAKDLVQDNISAAHPYSALTTAALAQAAGVPHANPQVVYVAPDKALGSYSRDFAGQVCLFEEREPYGNSISTVKLLKAVQKDNDNSVNQPAFLRDKLLDMYLADWDRHEDQWRWLEHRKNGSSVYTAIPRDRDQALYTNQGRVPRLVSRKWAAPYLQGFRDKVENVNELMYWGAPLHDRFLNNISYSQWMDITLRFVASFTDSVLEAALRRMPKAVDSIRHTQLLAMMKSRRDDMTRASGDYYRFMSRIVDVQTSDKNELVYINDTTNGRLWVGVYKISKKGKIEDELYNRILDPEITREVRVFLGEGSDSVVINKSSSPIAVRIVGSREAKHYVIQGAPGGFHNINIYDGTNAVLEGNTQTVHTHISNSDDNLAIVQTNRYNKTIPLPVVGYNLDDGIIAGMGFVHFQQGFRKTPYASSQQLQAGVAFATGAFRVVYTGEWMNALGKADIVLHGDARVPSNVSNFFGEGNETPFIKTGDNYIRYYRTRFANILANAMLRWRNSSNRSSISVGPAVQFYDLDSADNEDRFITTHPGDIGTYDSLSVARAKMHAGIEAAYILDTRNNKVLPAWGVFIDVRARAYKGFSGDAKNYAQLVPQFAFYKSLNAKSSVVLADRLGGGIGLGHAAFYQSMYLGGQGNLLGYRQYRFAGKHMAYNNLEIRVKLTDFTSYLFPGEFGLLGFYDIGRVWATDDHSGQWHNGVGGGLYVAPVRMAVFRVTIGYSHEGVLPYFALNFRF